MAQSVLSDATAREERVEGGTRTRTHVISVDVGYTAHVGENAVKSESRRHKGRTHASR